jgi:hypothetical protein
MNILLQINIIIFYNCVNLIIIHLISYNKNYTNKNSALAVV